MEEYKNIVCLICLDTFADGMENAFIDENDSTILSPCGYLYEQILDLQIPHQLDSPKLCQTCCLLLNDFADFKTKAYESHSKLSKLLDAPTDIEVLDDSIEFELEDFQHEIKIEKIDELIEEQEQSEAGKFTVDSLEHSQAELMVTEEIVVDKNEKTEPKVTTYVDTTKSSKRTCFTCGKLFRTQRLMKQHRRDEHKFRRYECPYCPKMCVKLDNFHMHIREHGMKPDDVCDKIEKKMIEKMEFVDVVVEEQPTSIKCEKMPSNDDDDDYDDEKEISTDEKEVRKKVYECNSCNKVFRTQNQMETHRRQFHRILKYKCPYCPRSCRKFYLFELHVRSHGDESYLAYKNSSKEFRELVESESLAESAANEDNIKWNQCHDCGITFESVTDLALHREKSHNIVPRKCPHCSKLIFQQDLFELHLRIEHQIETENSGNYDSEEKLVHECGKCGKIFHSKQLALKHWRKEHKEPIQKCPKCPKTFKRKSLFELHLQTHLDESLIECGICKKQLNSKANYGRHIKIHRAERDFVCHLCGKQCLMRGELLTHVRVFHKKERPFECETCGKKFLMRSHLTTHLYHHTGGIECPICNKKMSNPAGLKAHIRIVHQKIKAHQCHICSKFFNTKWFMGVHIKKQHGIQ